MVATAKSEDPQPINKDIIASVSKWVDTDSAAARKPPLGHRFVSPSHLALHRSPLAAAKGATTTMAQSGAAAIEASLEAGTLARPAVPNYQGPLYPGVCELRMYALVEECKGRVRRQEQCRVFVYYLLFLLVFLGVQLCYPMNSIARFNAQSREWLTGQNSPLPVQSVASLDDVWVWLNQTYVAALWEEEDGEVGLVRGFDSVVGGIVLWQREFNVEEQCSSFEQEFVKACRLFDRSAGYNVSKLQDSVSAVLPKVSVLHGGNRDKLFAEVIPLYAMPSGTTTVANSQLVPVASALSQIEELRNSGWLHYGTDEVTAMLVLYSSSNKLLHSVQTRFIQGIHGEVTGEVDVWSGVVSSFSDGVVQAGGGPWQLRITLEILFSFAVLVSFLNEVAELIGSLYSTGFVVGMRGYLFNPWNWIDILLIALAGIVIALQIQLYLQEDILQQALYGTDPESLDMLFARIMSLANLSELFSLANSFCLLLAFLRVTKLAEFHPNLGKAARTIAKARNDLLGVAALFCVIFVGATVTGWFLFSRVNTRFATILSAASSVGEMLTFGLSYNELINSQSSDRAWWTWLPTSLFYFGFMVLAFLLFANIVLSIYVATAQKVDVDSEEIARDSLLPPGPPIFASCSGICRSKRSIKVQPGTLPDDPIEVHQVSPEKLLQQLTEVNQKIVLGLEQPTSGRRVITSYRAVEGTPGTPSFIVAFDYSDLCQTFTSDVASYLWVLFRSQGRSAPILQEVDSQKSSPVDDEIVDEVASEKQQEVFDSSSAKVEEVLLNLHRLEEAMRTAFARLDVAMKKRAVEESRARKDHPVSNEINKQLSLLVDTTKIDHTIGAPDGRPQHTIVGKPKEFTSIGPSEAKVNRSESSTHAEDKSTLSLVARPIKTRKSETPKSSDSVASTASPLAPKEAAAKDKSAEPKTLKSPQGHQPGSSGLHSEEVTGSTNQVSKGIDLGNDAPVVAKERKRRKSSLELKPKTIFKTQELDAAAEKIQKQYRKRAKDAASSPAPSSPAARKEALRKILLSLFSPDGTCPLQKIKSHFQDKASVYDWQEVKQVRREMGIIQYKQLLRHEGGATVIRLWRKPK